MQITFLRSDILGLVCKMRLRTVTSITGCYKDKGVDTC